jgi:hypothetical protein
VVWSCLSRMNFPCSFAFSYFYYVALFNHYYLRMYIHVFSMEILKSMHCVEC